MTEGNAVLASEDGTFVPETATLDGSVSVGLPAPGALIRICEPGSRIVLRRGETGELHIGGVYVIKGYLGTTSDNLYEDETGHWIVTGDRAVVDESGKVYILGRYKDLIIRGGENISPASIECCLDQIDGITVSSAARPIFLKFSYSPKVAGSRSCR